jgi:hypothetical protein
MLIKSKSQEEELTTTYYRYLSRPSPEVFMKKFRAAWKLEEAEFQFSLETLVIRYLVPINGVLIDMKIST